MIEYTAEYDEDTKPFLCKKITVGDEVIRTEITIHNKKELDNFSDEVIYEHLNNLVFYMKNDIAPQLEIIAYKEPLVEPWPVAKWHDLTHINDEICEWYNFVYYRVEALQEDEIIEESPA